MQRTADQTCPILGGRVVCAPVTHRPCQGESVERRDDASNCRRVPGDIIQQALLCSVASTSRSFPLQPGRPQLQSVLAPAGVPHGSRPASIMQPTRYRICLPLWPQMSNSSRS
jgi:hypothetical protein